MLVHADWVLPISSTPIRDGAVYVHGHHIRAVGTLADLQRDHPDESVTRHDGCVLLPGLVNAHTHLALTALHGIIPSLPFHEWLPLLVRAKRALTPDDLAASMVLGAHRAMASGTTVVGEIAYGPESPAIAADTGLGGTFYWEVLGVEPSGVPALLDELEYPREGVRHASGRQRHGISPHAPYTSGPDLLTALHERTSAEETGYAIHVAESPAETLLMRDGTGPLAAIAARTASRLHARDTSPVRYLAELGVLDGALAIHCAEVLPVDVPPLASRVAGVVLCPRSNAYVHTGPAPVDSLLRNDATLGLGTDSLASNTDLDLFEEARALCGLSSDLTPERVVRIMTAEGAKALGLADSFGTLEPEKQADLAIFRVDGGDDPYAALLSDAGRSTIVSVLAAGVWRVLSGSATFPSRFAENAVRNASVRASMAID